MSKVNVLPGQEALVIDSPSPTPQTPFNAVSYVNAQEGIIHLEDLPGFDLDPERTLTYVEFMGDIGIALAEEPRQSETWDSPLDAHGEDFEKASVNSLTKGLYFKPLLSSHRTEVITIGRKEPGLDAPGVRGVNEGVAVTGDEYKAIARSPGDLAKHVHANTKEANDKRPPKEKLDDETLQNTAGRSMAHVLRSKKEELLELDKELKIERLALSAVNGLAATEDAPKQSIGEMDWYRRVSAIAIHGTVKVASDQLNYGTTVRWGINRALVSAFHRGDPAAISAALKNYTRFAGYHIDAKRGKLYQSLSVCQDEFRKHRHYLRTKKPTI
jgi:hypothetical protein